jgi:hypothetical protein
VAQPIAVIVAIAHATLMTTAEIRGARFM